MAAVLLAAVSIPLALLIVIAVRCTSRGPVLNRTLRLGRGGRVFTHYRFRNRTVDPVALTPVGRFIGNLSLDEIPSLWNVLRGDLSIVGPRPPKPSEVDFSSVEWQRVLSIRPGLCSLGGLTFLERFNDTPVHERIKPDIEYVDQRSWWLDVCVMTKAAALWLRMGHFKGPQK